MTSIRTAITRALLAAAATAALVAQGLGTLGKLESFAETEKVMRATALAEGAKIAEDGGVTVIMDRCLKVEHARYVGRMHWLGFNTQRITSVRAGLQ